MKNFRNCGMRFLSTLLAICSLGGLSGCFGSMISSGKLKQNGNESLTYAYSRSWSVVIWPLPIVSVAVGYIREISIPEKQTLDTHWSIVGGGYLPQVSLFELGGSTLKKIGKEYDQTEVVFRGEKYALAEPRDYALRHRFFVFGFPVDSAEKENFVVLQRKVGNDFLPELVYDDCSLSFCEN